MRHTQSKSSKATSPNFQDAEVIKHYTDDLVSNPANARKIRKANPDLKAHFDKADRAHKAAEVQAVLNRQKGK